MTSEEIIGRYQLIAIGYANCPDICPTTPVKWRLFSSCSSSTPTNCNPSSSPSIRRAAVNFKIRYNKLIEPGAKPGFYAVDHSAGMILLGPDGQYLKKIPFATPVDQIAAQITALIKKRPKT